MSDTTIQIIRVLILIGLTVSRMEAVAAPQSADDTLAHTPDLSPAIHATRLDYSEFESPEAVTVITQEDIRLAGYLEVSEIFRSVPGFRIVKIGDEARLSYHGTTARQNRRMLVSIDGRSVLIGDGQYVEFDRLPIGLEDIARVTIVRGPNGAAYGDNAFFTSIDFKTIGKDDPRGTAVRAGGGYNGRRKLATAVNEQIGPYELSFSAGIERDGGYDFSDSAGTPRDDGRDIRRGQLTLQREFTEGSQWRLDANAYNSSHQGGIQALSFTGTQRNDGQFVSVSNRREMGEFSRFDWLVSHNRQLEAIRQYGCYTPEAIARTRAILVDPEAAAALLAPTLFVPGLLGTSLEDTCFFSDIDIRSRRTEVEAEYESRRGPWRYLLGGSATQVDASSAQYFAGRDQDQRSYRIFGESSLALGTLHTSVGLMAQDSSNVEDTEVAWRAALNWQFLRNQALRYSYASSFRIPSLVETETFWTGAFLFGRRDDPLSSYPVSLPLPLVTSNVRLKPETIESHAIGYFGTFFRSSATLDVKAFTETIHHPVEASVFYFSPPPVNAGSFTLSGVESEFALRLNDRWRISGHYSYLDTDAQSIVERGLHGDGAGSLSLSYTPVARHAFTLAYYGNSTISGHSYDRYDLVYNYSREFYGHLFRSQLIYHRHVGGADGIRDPVVPLASNEGYFAHLNQFFLNLEWVF